MILDKQYHELAFYTLSHQDKRFIHQHIVDAYTAQMADNNTKWIAIFFSLAGLYLFVEKNYTGKQVQNAHIQMAKHPKDNTPFVLPVYRGDITIKQVLDAAPGTEKDAMIDNWCKSVWAAFASQHQQIIALTEVFLYI